MDPDDENVSQDYGEEDEEAGGKYISQLQKAWVNEKAAPDILDYKEETVQNLLELVKEQETSAQEHANDTTTHQFLFNVYQMEIGRLKYMLSAYLRTRLWKIEKYHIHILNSDVLKGRLSPAEIRYAQEYRRGLQGHMLTSCLDALPDSFRKVDVVKAGQNMVPAPDQSAYVFCHVEDGQIGDVVVDEMGTTLSLAEKDRLAVQYKYVEPLVREGKVRLL